MRIKTMNRLIRLLTTKDVVAITLAPFGIYVREAKTLDNIYIIRHEKIHWKQQMEMLIVPFYLWYLIEWLIKVITPPVGAYDDLSMEREANAFMFDPTYLQTRKHYNWINYLTNKKKDDNGKID